MDLLRLDLKHYETVAAIVTFGTMTEAASHLATSQSALSHRLREAERRLGTALFERAPSRRLVPTRAGLAMNQVATRALSDLARFEASVFVTGGSVPTVVRIAVGSYDCYHWFPSFLAAIRSRHLDLDLELVVVGDAPGSALASHDVDLVIAAGEPEGRIELQPLFEDELVVVVDPAHPLATQRTVEAEDLVDETYMTYNAQPTPGFEYDRFIRPARSYPKIVRVVRQTSAIAELVAAGAGVSILSRWALRPALEARRVVAVSCGQDGLPLMWHAALRPGDDVARMVAEDLRAHLSERTPDPVSVGSGNRT